MRRFIRWLLWTGIVIAALMVGALAVGRSEPSSQRAFDFTYSARISALPSDGHDVRIWVPLAKTRDHQTILSRHIHTALPYRISEEPVYGNDMLYLQLKPPIPASLDVVIEYTAVERGGRWLDRRRLFKGYPETSAAELSLALRNEPFMVINDTVKQLAQDATVGRTSPLEKARAIYDYVIAHMTYDKTTPGWGRGDTLRACQLGKGNCADFHSLFISMARAVDTPARFAIGATIPTSPGGEIPGYHCWAEFYSPTEGWVPVDASEAWKHPDLREYYFGTRDPNKFLISVGRNIQLVPLQAGPPVNIFLNPYVEVDGRSAGVVETRFSFTSRKDKVT